MKDRPGFIEEAPTQNHKQRVLFAAQAQLALKKKRVSIFDFSLRFANPMAAVASAVFILLAIGPRFSKEVLPLEAPPAELSFMSLEPAEWEDLEIVMELESLEQWEEVDEWPEG